MKTSKSARVSEATDVDRMLEILLEPGNNLEDMKIDVPLEENIDEERYQTAIDFSVGREIVPVPDDTNFRRQSANKNLSRLYEFEVMSKDDLVNKRIVHPEMNDYSIINRFREIRTSLLKRSQGKNFSVMVVSLRPEMGSTFATVNLGAAFAYEGGKTSLLIDCNKGAPKLANLLNLKPTRGISDYIADPNMDVADIIYPVGINRMRLIPYGQARDTGLEFMGSERMREFLDVIKRRYIDRYLILKAPPLESSADAIILSEMVDYVVIVVPYGRITPSRLRKATNLLPREKIAGLVLNDCKSYV